MPGKIKKGQLQHQVMPHDAEMDVSNVPKASFYLDLFFLILFFYIVCVINGFECNFL